MKTTVLLMALLWIMPMCAQEITLDLLADGFSSPIGIEHANDDRLFIIEQAGLVKIIDDSGMILDAPFLDLSDSTTADGEQGLLGFAFHPDYQNNGYFFVQYSDAEGDNKLCRYSRSDNDPNLANPNSEILIKRFFQPFNNHNGGDINFGPDGYLYIALGDGGGSGDPLNRAQNPLDYLGKLLRIDVDGGMPYQIPPDNPFVNMQTHLPEIWATGLRNPWRFSFDSDNGDLWIADVGQNNWEEINFEFAGHEGGKNYGWKCYEAEEGYSNCPENEMEFPIFQYNHADEFGGSSITGGLVYRGEKFPNLKGHYVFSDFISGNFWSIELNENPNSNALHLGDFQDFRYTAFGENSAKDLFVADYTGKIFEIIDTSTILPLQIVDWHLFQNKEEVNIFWESENEDQVKSYIVQRSIDGAQFQDLKEVQVKFTNASIRNHYTLQNVHVNHGINYFRIKQLNKDGSYDLTDIKAHQFIEALEQPKVYPNPFANFVTLESPLFEGQIIKLKLYNVQTSYVSHQIINNAGRSIDLKEMVSGINKGIYILEIELDLQHYQIKVVKI